jgi:endonuclease YncB( thermonuclease family)
MFQRSGCWFADKSMRHARIYSHFRALPSPPVSTEGMRECNYGRACGVLTAHGRDVGATMIQEGIARPYVCGATSCPRRASWY